jgi:outer membrane protein assembly factor BamE (lipoprotein component of BamABCDE complex)
MKLLISLSFALLTIGLLSGCETPGQALKKSAVEQIRDGQTTKAEVDKIFGEPMQMTKSPEGRTLYLYQRFYGPDVQTRGGFDPRRNESNLIILSVLFNGAGVVEKHLYSHTQPNVDRSMASAGARLGPDELKRIVPKKTTRAELGAWFGVHWSEQLTLSGHRLVTWLYLDAFNLTSRVDVQALEVVVDDAGTVLDFRVTKKDHRN